MYYENMKIMKLPELNDFSNFSTIGPSGEAFENVNGTAVAIECFLDIHRGSNIPKIRWTNYNHEMNSYQGSLENKDKYVSAFKEIKSKRKDYNFDKLEHLIEEIYENCCSKSFFNENSQSF